eukprot:670775-Lingulodinium_polyedra.AAC.1
MLLEGMDVARPAATLVRAGPEIPLVQRPLRWHRLRPTQQWTPRLAWRGDPAWERWTLRDVRGGAY